MHELLELWCRDPIECVQDLMGNPAFWNAMSYVPKCAYTDANGENWIYDEMWTGNWWWDVQGAVVAPVILSLDKTSLLQFSGDKKAWPVYLTIGNISKDVRCQVSAHATVLIGYLPVSKLECFQKKTRSLVGYRLFHHSMSLLLCPLANASHHGRDMVCADGYLRHIHPILVCLVACNKESRCPRCLVKSNKCGDLEDWASQSMADMLKTLNRMRKNKRSRKFDAKGLHAVFDPFWKDLPFTNIFACLTPNILHQLHKGVFHDHLVQWCMSIVGEKEIDAQFQAMTHYPALHHFKKGISSVSQWTRSKHKEMQRVFIGLLAGTVDDRILLQRHTDTTLAVMDESLKTFHDHKDVLVKLEIHSLQHYVASIRALGSDGYRTSNKRDYMEQMALWLQCQEAMQYRISFEGGSKRGDRDSETHIGSCSRSTGVSGLPDVPMPQIMGTVYPTLTLFITMKARYKVAKTPPHRQVSIDSIEGDYKATEFLPTPEHFLRVIWPIRSDRFDVYNYLYVMTGPSIITGHGQSYQKIRVSPKIASHGWKAETAARFDTVFMMDEERPCTLKCMQLAQVRVIFKLPEVFRTFPHPLAYIEWFTTLQCQDPVSGLFIVTCSTRNCHCNASIISIDHIDRVCHLQGRCGREISKEWSADSVLENAASFFVNSYINLDTFLSLE
ncbi:hypothetical protein BKA83DRAFT_4527015 [Pisolithus microcarpus]|nr:hypothetical protein BKA83DRAFT_4527015 [Pisolithus microcarpus]